jgi:hypothetical protein
LPQHSPVKRIRFAWKGLFLDDNKAEFFIYLDIGRALGFQEYRHAFRIDLSQRSTKQSRADALALLRRIHADEKQAVMWHRRLCIASMMCANPITFTVPANPYLNGADNMPARHMSATVIPVRPGGNQSATPSLAAVA